MDAVAQPEGRPRGKSVHPAIAVVAVIALLAFVSWQAYSTLFAPPQPAPMDAVAQKKHDLLKEFAIKSGGDFGKLSEADRKRAQDIAGPWAGMAVKTIYKELNSETHRIF